MTRSYRANGRDHLARAKALLAMGDDISLVYCALELRMSIEAHVYETAQSYTDELPERKLSKWQPAKLLAELLAIDPHVDRSGALSFARETNDGSPQEWETVGTLKRMPLKEVSDLYNKLGSYLHLETVLDHNEGKTRDWTKARGLCVDIVERLQDLYSTSLLNLKFGTTTQMECFICMKTIKRRLNSVKDGETLITQCSNDCVATYSLTIKGDKVHWKARFDEVPCQQPECAGTVQIWERHAKANNSFLCNICGKASKLVLTLRADDAEVKVK